MVTRYVNTAADPGGDGTTTALTGANCAYRSLNIAESALPASLSEPWEIVCDGSGSDGTAVTFSGSTASDSNYIYVHPSEAAAHVGVWDDTKYRLLVTSNYTPLTISELFVRVSRLQIKWSSSGSSTYNGVALNSSGTGWVEFDHNIVVGAYTGSSTTGNHIGVNCLSQSGSAVVCRLSNNIVYGWSRSGGTNRGISTNQTGTCTYFLYSNTVASCGVGYSIGGSATRIKNCLAQGCTDGFSGTPNASSAKNCSDISSDAPGTDPVTGTVTFAGADDYHLASSDTIARGAGVDLSGDGDYPITTDIDGQTRTGAWDIGADQYVAAGGGPVIPVFMNQYRQRWA